MSIVQSTIVRQLSKCSSDMLIFNYLVIMNQFSNVVSYFLACQTQIENQLATATDGGQPNSTTEVVANVLDMNTKKKQSLPSECGYPNCEAQVQYTECSSTTGSGEEDKC